MQRLQPPAGAADPAGQRRTRKIDAMAGEDLRLPIERRVIAIFADQHLGEQRRRRQAAGDWPFRGRRLRHRARKSRQAYLGRVMRRTRSCAGTQSSISLTLSPMTCSAPPQQAHDHAVNIEADVFARQMVGQRFATGGPSRARLLLRLPRPLDGSSRTRARSLSRSSRASAIWSGSRRSERRPNCARCNFLMIELKALDLAVAAARRRPPCREPDGAEEPYRQADRRDRIACSNSTLNAPSSSIFSMFCLMFRTFSASDRRSPDALGSPPVDALDQHGELRRTERDRSLRTPPSDGHTNPP